mgnify:CR=1 FL=1
MITMVLRKNLSEENRVIKSFADADVTLEGTFKEQQNLLRPEITIETDLNLSTYNYCEIAEFGRKYFMKPHVIQTHIWTLELEVDVLSTYADGIGNSEALVKRTGKEGKMNFYINDGVLYTEQREVITYHDFMKNNVEATFGTPSYYLLVAGG